MIVTLAAGRGKDLPPTNSNPPSKYDGKPSLVRLNLNSCTAENMRSVNSVRHSKSIGDSDSHKRNRLHICLIEKYSHMACIYARHGA